MNAVMSRWDERYQGRQAAEATPCQVLAENAHLLPKHGTALDLASGLSGNGQFLARHGLSVTAWDISPVACDKINSLAMDEGLELKAECIDIENELLPNQQFDVVAVSYFLNRERMPDYLQLLKPGGLLYYQTYTRESFNPGGPKNPAFRLARNELLHLCASLELVLYREEGDNGDTTQGLRGEAMLIARKPG